MSIQGNVNQGINIASFLYQQTPGYKLKEEGKRSVAELQRVVDKNIKSNVGDKYNPLHKEGFIKKLDTLNKDFNPEDEILVDKTIKEQKQQLEDIAKKYMDTKGRKISGRDARKAANLLSSSLDLNKDLLEKVEEWKGKKEAFDKQNEESLKEENSVSVEKAPEENAPVDSVSVKENLSTTEEDDAPVEESYETSPAKEDLSPAGKEVQRILSEDRAAESVMRAQQRQQRHAYMMDRARKMLNNQYDSGEINPYEWDTAMTENGLWGRNK